MSSSHRPVIHGNTPIQVDEWRISFTQFCSGGLFRYVAYGFRTMKDCASQNLKLKAKVDAKAGQRWKDGLRRFSKVDELHADRMKVFCK